MHEDELKNDENIEKKQHLLDKKLSTSATSVYGFNCALQAE